MTRNILDYKNKNKFFPNEKFKYGKNDPNDEKKEKENFFNTNDFNIEKEIEKENKKKADFKIEQTIKRLDIWETEHLIENKTNFLTIFKSFIESKFLNLKDKWSNQGKTNTKTTAPINRYSLKKSMNENSLNNSELPDFLDNEEHDQTCILLQNISVFRRKFDFSIFLDKECKGNISKIEVKSTDRNIKISKKISEYFNEKNEEKLIKASQNTISLNNFKEFKDEKDTKENLKNFDNLSKNLNKYTKEYNDENFNYNNKIEKVDNASLSENSFNMKSTSKNGGKTALKTYISSKIPQININSINNNLEDVYFNSTKSKENFYKQMLKQDHSSIEIGENKMLSKNKFKIIQENLNFGRNKETYINKNYLESKISFKKEFEKSENIVYLNNGYFMSMKAKVNQIDTNKSLNNFVYNNITSGNDFFNYQRIFASKDRKLENSTKEKIEKSDCTKNFSNKNSTFSMRSMGNSLNKISLSSKSILKCVEDKTDLNNCDILNFKVNEMKINIPDSNEKAEEKKLVRKSYKDNNIRYYQKLLEKYKKMKNDILYEKLDTVDHYKKIIKKKIEKENIVKNDVINIHKLIIQKKQNRKKLNHEKCEIVIKINKLKENFSNEFDKNEKQKEQEEQILFNLMYNANNFLQNKVISNSPQKLVKKPTEEISSISLAPSPIRKRSNGTIPSPIKTQQKQSNPILINGKTSRNPIFDIKNDKILLNSNQNNINLTGNTNSSNNPVVNLIKNENNSTIQIENKEENPNNLKNKIMSIFGLKKKSSKGKENELNNLEQNNNKLNTIRKNSNSENRGIYAGIDIKYQEIFKKLKSDYELKKEEYEKRVENINKTLLTLDSDIKLLKSNLNILNSKQREYYLDILMRGIDVRLEGLMWIVKRLIELNSPIDHSIFPRFLDTQHIDYIIYISFKSIEIIQIKILLKTLREKHLRENKNKLKDFHFKETNQSKKSSPLKNLSSIKRKTLNYPPEKFISGRNLVKDFENAEKNFIEKEKENPSQKNFNSSTGFVNVILTNIPEKNNMDKKGEKFTGSDNDSEGRYELFSDDIINNSVAIDNKKKNIEENKEDMKNNMDNLQIKKSCEIFFTSNCIENNSDFYLRSFSDKALNIFENIFKKYEMIGENKFFPSKEDKLTFDRIKLIKNKLTKISLKQRENEEILEDIGEKTNNVIEFINNNYEENVYLNEIMKLKETIKEYEEDIKSQKQNQIRIFSKRFEIVKSTGEFSIENEMIYSSLFGNGIV